VPWCPDRIRTNLDLDEHIITRRRAINAAILAYESHYMDARKDKDVCAKCGRSFRDSIHLRDGETTQDRINALKEPL